MNVSFPESNKDETKERKKRSHDQMAHFLTERRNKKLKNRWKSIFLECDTENYKRIKNIDISVEDCNKNVPIFFEGDVIRN